MYLQSYLRKKSSSPIEVRYLQGHVNLDEHLKQIDRYKPDIYGLSFALWTEQLAYTTLRAVRARFPGLRIVCGGPQPTASYTEALVQGAADVCVLGEGEATMLELIE